MPQKEAGCDVMHAEKMHTDVGLQLEPIFIQKNENFTVSHEFFGGIT